MAAGVAEQERGGAHIFAGRGAGVDGGASGGEFFIDGVGRDVAARDVDDVEARALAQKTDGRRRGWVARRIKMRGDFRAVAVGFGRTDDGVHGVRDAGHVFEQFGDLALFPQELLGVSEMLILAAAAAGEKRAHGRDAMRRRREDGNEIRLGVILVVAKNAGADAFAGQTERHHDDPFGGGVFRMWNARQAHAVVGERGDLQLELGVIREREVVGFLFGFYHRKHKIHESEEDEEDSFFVCFAGFMVRWRRGSRKNHQSPESARETTREIARPPAARRSGRISRRRLSGNSPSAGKRREATRNLFFPRMVFGRERAGLDCAS